MQFFKFEGFAVNEKWAEENDSRRIQRERSRKICVKSEEFNKKMKQKAFFCIVDAGEDIITACIICREKISLNEEIPAFMEKVGIDVRDTVIEEITFEEAQDLLQHADTRDYIADTDRVWEKLGLGILNSRYGRGLDYTEDIIDEISEKDAYSSAERFAVTESFVPELDRIYSKGNQTNIIGHPVHYFIETDDVEARKGVLASLLGSLYANGRIQNRRYVYIDLNPMSEFPCSVFDCLYKSCIGGTIVIRYRTNDDREDDRASGGRNNIEKICEKMREYRNQVLTVFCLPRECTKTKSVFLENLVNSCFVEIKEDFLADKNAENFLKKLAKNNGIKADKKLCSELEEGKGYLVTDLRAMYDEWFNSKLKTSVYPQYSGLVSVEKLVKEEKQKGNAYTELNEMIGLGSAKSVINRALDYYKAQKLFAEKGMKNEVPSMHMVFTGNPGTAKTTVARLFAEIMRENGILSKGRLIEVGRGDIVGKFVGWTAPTIQQKFREAQGSVLFIDEAYSLVDDRDGSYGDEAINTIVQEMENHRDDVVVIFAGYPDKMEKFLQKNPGLRSRIAFHVSFEDYSTQELVEIAELIAKKKGLTLTDSACEKLEIIFENARIQGDFGNGRFVRNMLEKAKMAQAGRLLKMDFDSVGKDDITTICAEDIEIPESKCSAQTKKIGFCA